MLCGTESKSLEVSEVKCISDALLRILPCQRKQSAASDDRYMDMRSLQRHQAEFDCAQVPFSHTVLHCFNQWTLVTGRL